MNHSPDSDGCLYNKSTGYGYDHFNEQKWEGSDSSEEETYVHRIRHEQSKLKNGISLIL